MQISYNNCHIFLITKNWYVVFWNEIYLTRPNDSEINFYFGPVCLFVFIRTKISQILLNVLKSFKTLVCIKIIQGCRLKSWLAIENFTFVLQFWVLTERNPCTQMHMCTFSNAWAIFDSVGFPSSFRSLFSLSYLSLLFISPISFAFTWMLDADLPPSMAFKHKHTFQFTFKHSTCNVFPFLSISILLHPNVSTYFFLCLQ